MRKFINILNEATNPLTVFPETKTFRVYHGTDVIEPFDKFDPDLLNSRAGRAHGAFFFARSKTTAMTYLDTEEILKPAVQKKYDELMAEYNNRMSELLVHVNKILADHGEPPVKKYDSWKLTILAINRRKTDPYDTLRDEITRIQQMAEPVDWCRKQAWELTEREANTTTSHFGTLYTCELILRSIWEKDMNRMSFERNRWTDIFNAATQYEPDAVVLYNVGGLSP